MNFSIRVTLLLIKMTIVDLVGRECVVGKSMKVIWSIS